MACNVETLSQIMAISSGIFSGMNAGLSLAAVPGLMRSQDPLPVWKVMYLRASKIAMVSILTTTISGIYCFIKTGSGMENAGFLVTALLSFSIIPYTIIAMKPTNDHLFSIKDNEEANKVKGIVRKWERRHWVRTVVGAIVFGMAVFKIGQK